jgi:hypothetical protein
MHARMASWGYEERDGKNECRPCGKMMSGLTHPIVWSDPSQKGIFCYLVDTSDQQLTINKQEAAANKDLY